MKGYRLSGRTRRTRHVTVAGDLTVTLDEDPGDYFPAALVTPQSSGPASEGSPRDNAARSRLVYQGEQELSVSDRFEVYGGEEYELLTAPRPLRTGGHVKGFEVECLEVDTLYPRDAVLYEQGGETAVDDPDASGVSPLIVPMAIYTPAEDETDRGSYTATEGEAPIDFAAQLTVKNRILDLDARWHIAEAVIEYEVPRVRMRLRRA